MTEATTHYNTGGGVASGAPMDTVSESNNSNAQISSMNFAIVQYESILQKLNSEFHALMAKNRQTEEAL